MPQPLAQETEMIPQCHKDIGDREDPKIDPESFLSDVISFSEFAEFTDFSENLLY